MPLGSTRSPKTTSATFTDLGFRLTRLFFVKHSSKFVTTPATGDLMIFPPGSMVTMENRRVMQIGYRSVGLSFGHGFVRAVFKDQVQPPSPPKVQLFRAQAHARSDILPLMQDTLNTATLPPAIRRYGVQEPLTWLRAQGCALQPRSPTNPSTVSGLRSTKTRATPGKSPTSTCIST